ncbi:MAG TPA: nucleoside hydrolase [Actinomycetales bacterium]|nr:nucleoside hydrolase [Actinomycetales bacterium]
MRIILDTDLAMGTPGSDIDDGFALALAVADPELTIDFVTTVSGNTDVRSATVLTRELLYRLDVFVPVHQGAAGPIMDPWRDLPAAESRAEDLPRTGRAAQLMVDRVVANPGEITIVAIGPFTNLATAMLLEPSLAQAAAGIVVMGGYFTGHMRDLAAPGDFNVWADPEAAAIVLASGARLRMVGLDVTYQVRMVAEEAQRLARSAGAFAPFAGECALGWIETLRERYPDSAHHGSFPLHDPLAVAAVAHPELLTWEPAHVEVALSGVARGVTIAGPPGDGRPANAEIATGVRADAFLEYFLEHMESL